MFEYYGNDVELFAICKCKTTWKWTAHGWVTVWGLPMDVKYVDINMLPGVDRPDCCR